MSEKDGSAADRVDARRMPRRRFLQLAAGTAAVTAGAGALSACALRSPLRISLQTWSGFQLLRLAQQQGQLDASVQLLPARTVDEVRQALRTGTTDAAGLTLDEALRLRSEGLPLQVCLVFDISAGADVLLARPGIGHAADLRGKRLGVENTALGALVLHEMLRATGLERTDLVVVPISERHVADWRKGGLDALLTYGTAAKALEGEGLVRLLDSRHMRTLIADVLAVKSDAADHLGGRVREAVAAHFRGLDQWQHNPIDTAYGLSALLDAGPENIRGVMAGLDLPDRTYNRHLLSPPATELTRTAHLILDVLTREGLVTSPVALDGFFTPDFLPTNRE